MFHEFLVVYNGGVIDFKVPLESFNVLTHSCVEEKWCGVVLISCFNYKSALEFCEFFPFFECRNNWLYLFLILSFEEYFQCVGCSVNSKRDSIICIHIYILESWFCVEFQLFIGAEEISGNRQTILYYSALYKGYKYTLSICYDYNS